MKDRDPSAQISVRRRTVVLLVCGGVLVAGLAAAGTWYATKRDDPPQSRSRGISVVAIVSGSQNVDGSFLSCRGASNFSAFLPGQPASLLDANGNLVAVATIGDSQTAIDKLINEEEFHGGTGLVSEIHNRASEKVTKIFRDGSGSACVFHMVFYHLSYSGLYNVQVGTYRFPVDVSAAPVIDSLVWNVN